MTNTVLILGASGNIGRHSTQAFAAAGWTVRKYDRKAGNMTAAARGADVIINGLNPPNYHDWARTIPAITAQVIAAAQASGATVIIPGNVYNIGATPGTWSETTPQNPVSRKGQIRKDMEASYRAAGVPTIILRAGNFIDPDKANTVISMVMLAKAKRGKITTIGGPDVMQAYAYLPDWAQAVVMLAEKRDALATFEDIPFEGHAFTVNQLRAELEAALGRSFRVTRFPWWLMRLSAPVWELAREMNEMRYLFNTDHRLSGQKLARLLPDFHLTPIRQVMLAGLPADIRPDQGVARGAGLTLA